MEINETRKEINDGIENEALRTSPKKGKSLIQLIKFALVGASNTIVDMIVNTGLHYVLSLFLTGGWILYFCKAVGYCCGILNSYILNSRWTFRDEHRKDKREVLGFIAVNLAVLLISFGLIYVFKNKLLLGEKWMALGLPEWLTKIVTGDVFCSLLATCICIPVNFILNKLFVFKGKNEEGEVEA